MAKRAQGAGGTEALRVVAASPVIQAMEVQLARDLLAPRLSISAPKNVKIP